VEAIEEKGLNPSALQNSPPYLSEERGGKSDVTRGGISYMPRIPQEGLTRATGGLTCSNTDLREVVGIVSIIF